MKRTAWYSLTLALPFIIASCGGEKGGSEESSAMSNDVQEVTPTITITPLTDSPKFPDAQLTLNEPGEKTPAGQVNFDFSVENYTLGAQTSDAEGKGLANSGKGQHIHLILNNGPYSAHYEPTFGKEMEDGHYVALAFLSRSYHESVKVPGAFAISQFDVGEVAESEKADLSAPHMFYSRPKGTYKGDDTKNLLLDFFLLNTDLAPDGNKVRATINGQEFMIDQWVPHVIHGLELGEVMVKLELLDAEGNLVDSPFNPVERKVMLEAAPTAE